MWKVGDAAEAATSRRQKLEVRGQNLEVSPSVTIFKLRIEYCMRNGHCFGGWQEERGGRGAGGSRRGGGRVVNWRGGDVPL